MRPLSDHLPLILPHVPGCPAQTALDALSAVISEFLARTHVRRHETVCKTVPAGVCYVSTRPAAGYAEHILWVMAGGVKLLPADAQDINPEQLGLSGRPQAFWLLDDCIQLYPCPDETIEVQMGIVLRTAREEGFSDSGLFEEYADTLVSGTVARLALIPAQPWSSPELVTYHRRQFEQALTHARVRDRRTAPMRVKSQRFE